MAISYAVHHHWAHPDLQNPSSRGKHPASLRPTVKTLSSIHMAVSPSHPNANSCPTVKAFCEGTEPLGSLSLYCLPNTGKPDSNCHLTSLHPTHSRHCPLNRLSLFLYGRTLCFTTSTAPSVSLAPFYCFQSTPDY